MKEPWKASWRVCGYYTCKGPAMYISFKYLLKHPYVNLFLWKLRLNKEFPKLSAQTHEISDFSGARGIIYLSNGIWSPWSNHLGMSPDLNWYKWVKSACNWLPDWRNRKKWKQQQPKTQDFFCIIHFFTKYLTFS